MLQKQETLILKEYSYDYDIHPRQRICLLPQYGKRTRNGMELVRKPCQTL